ncbi:hypothetical protein [Actinoplanes derwentensis]|uniref:Uncharacterized protein n=1 Tax=Actinoplanes derwentensis TaxID=113562 RepID=A0A1H2C8Q0_9ACTN|nr:hypothetical protein [Actinoplanes derwentensis]GID86527.1 hypothetical protein Ade03nite_54510 [Actinoplanes derwentensis]SDT66657.1 hypothetical protein SAMN04489716_5373 [Actinoplanes derwentensis]
MTSEPMSETDPRQSRVDPDPRLRAIAVTVGVLTAGWVSFLRTSESGDNTFPVGAALLALVPALLAALPFALPTRLRPAADTTVAILVTVYSGATFPATGLHYVPMDLLLWAAAIVPWRQRRRRGPLAVRLWHFTAGLLVALPGLASVGAVGQDMIPVLSLAALLYIAGPVTLGVLCAFQIRAAYGVIALLGTVSMISALLDAGFLFAAFWWFGGLYLTIGAVGWVTTPAHTRHPSPVADATA